MSNIELTFEEAEVALSFVKHNHSQDWYGFWAKIGRSLYSEFGESAKGIFEIWSRSTASEFDEKKFNSGWKAFKDTKETTIGSLIFEAKQGGWTPSRKKLTDEERKQRQKEYAKHRAEQAKKQVLLDKERVNSLKKELNTFLAWPNQFPPTDYMQEKCMADLPNYADVRLGRDQFNYPFLAWPYYNELFNKGDFCGYEKIYKRRYKNGEKQPNKFSCKNANTTEGFITFGTDWIHGRKRVFVVGGLAKAYAAHITSGEVIISAVGEGRILGVIKRLQEKHPDIEFVAAPDNDEAGQKVAHATDGFWTLPQAPGADWDDVYIHEGNAAAKAQLLNVRGFKTITSNTRYLQAEIKKGLNLLKSDMGTGKSFLFKKFVLDHQELKILIVSHRKELAKSLKASLQKDRLKELISLDNDPAMQWPHIHELVKSLLSDNEDLCITKKLIASKYQSTSIETLKSIDSYLELVKDVIEIIPVDYYEDLTIKNPDKNIDQHAALREARILVCSVDSLHKLAGSRWDVVIIDEVEQNLGQYFADTIQHPENCLNFIRFALTHSDYQIMADAHLGELTTDFCKEIGLHSGTFYHNQYKTGVDENGNPKKLFVYESKSHLTEEVMQQILAKGKRYIYANTKAEVKRIGTALEHERERKNFIGKTLVVHADSVKNDKNVAESLKKINDVVPELDVIVASPTLGTGFDISSKHHQFEKTIGFLSSRVGTSEEGHQGLNRARDVNEFHVYLDPTERSEPTDADYIYDKMITQVSAETMQVLSIDPTTGEFVSRNPLYEWLCCKVKAQNNKSKNNYKMRFLDLASESGYDIIKVAKKEAAAKFGEIIRSDASERNNRELLRDITNAPICTGEAFKGMMRNGEDFSPIEIEKSKVVHDLNLTDATDEELDTLFPMAKDIYESFKQPGQNVAINNIDAAIEFPTDLKDAVASALTFNQAKNRYINGIKRLAWVNVDQKTAEVFDRKDVQHSGSRVSWRHISIRRLHMIKLLCAAGIDEQLNYNGHKWTAEKLNAELGPWLKEKSNQERLYKYSGITITATAINNPCQWLNTHLKSFGVPIVPSKKRVNGKPVNCYAVDKDAWKGVQSLVAMRTRGINSRDKGDDGLIDIEALQRSVNKFVDIINAGEFKSGFNIQYKKLDEQCALAGQSDLRDLLAQTYAQIAHKFKDQITPQSDPPLASVLYKTTGKGGSPITNDEAIPHASLILSERKEDLQFANLQIAIKDLNQDEQVVVHDVIRIAVDELKLHKAAVIGHLVEFEVDSQLVNGFKHDKAKWAGHIKQALDIEAICASNRAVR